MMRSTGRSAATLGAAVAVAFLAAACGLRLGGWTATPSAPTVSPNVAATPASIPLRDGPIGPGTYETMPFRGGGVLCMAPPQPGCSESTADDTLSFTFTVPEGWAGIGGSIRLAAGENTPPGGATLIFERGGWLYSDPCHGQPPPDVEVGPTVDDFATALSDHPALDTTPATDVALAGYSGKYMELYIPSDIAGCTYFPWEPGLSATGPNQRWYLWILDVDGVRVVVQTTDCEGTSADVKAALTSIVGSIHIKH